MKTPFRFPGIEVPATAEGFPDSLPAIVDLSQVSLVTTPEHLNFVLYFNDGNHSTKYAPIYDWSEGIAQRHAREFLNALYSRGGFQPIFYCYPSLKNIEEGTWKEGVINPSSILEVQQTPTHLVVLIPAVDFRSVIFVKNEKNILYKLGVLPLTLDIVVKSSPDLNEKMGIR